MFRCMGIQSVVFLSFLFLLSSCGSQNAGGGAGEFTTVTMTAQPQTVRLESDVITGNTCPTSATSGGAYETDSVDVDVAATPYRNLTMSPLPVRIDTVTVSYTPKNAVSPAILAQPYPVGIVITSGTALIPVPVAPEILKSKLVSDYNLQPCSGTLYEYYVTITFSGVEIGGTGTRQEFSTNMSVAFADRAETSAQ
ncbi:lipoprotein, putative [Geotalea daltonii FRC-32]|uniref:Lipoprotein, putative n=1 Tax=Geotalea daltonii (strain DSM 22248 / JCM 15807 / FRC-32) TaxID=316067 RepID=B9M3I7_GEODF|nr:hypothetical protein [Geotalea daltonii]ACM21408.1 lipoprotein, putative [Geotalea daltonii FRC-32]